MRHLPDMRLDVMSSLSAVISCGGFATQDALVSHASQRNTPMYMIVRTAEHIK